MMILRNDTAALVTVTDIQIDGVSIISKLRDDLLDSGRFEDHDDLLTLLPGEQMAIGGNTIHWIEQ